MNIAPFFGALLAVSTQVNAELIVDQSPETTGASLNTYLWINRTEGQNFLEFFSISTAVQLTGMSIFTNPEFGKTGDQVTVRLLSDGIDGPGTVVSKTVESIDRVDFHFGSGVLFNRLHTTFSIPLGLSPGGYWIGMSGTSTEIGLSSLNDVQDNKMMLVFGDVVERLDSFGDMALQVEGTVGTVPLPGALPLLGLGLSGLAIRLRHRAQGAESRSVVL